jgi:hypothetical protein
MGFSRPYPDLPIVEWGRARGKAVHKAIELYEAGELDETSLHPDVHGHFQSYLAFKEDTGYSPSANELPVFHDGHRYRGTLDSYGYLTRNGKWGSLVIVDFKCSTKPDLQSAAYQLAAYAEAIPGPGAPFVEARLVVQLNKDKYKIHDVTSEKATEIFLAAVKVWWVTQGGQGLKL